MYGDLGPLQNRVTPFGDIVAIPQRGTFIGNRGIVHDPATKTLLGRRWTTKAWLVCVLHYKGRRREVMKRRSWTELFFLDEAIALAAGHRPCFFCRRQSAEAFRAAWATGRGGSVPLAHEMDAQLHTERLACGRKRVHAILGPVGKLPDGAVISAAGAVLHHCARPRVPLDRGRLQGRATISSCRWAADPTFHLACNARRLSAGLAPRPRIRSCLIFPAPAAGLRRSEQPAGD